MEILDDVFHGPVFTFDVPAIGWLSKVGIEGKEFLINPPIEITADDGPTITIREEFAGQWVKVTSHTS